MNTAVEFKRKKMKDQNFSKAYAEEKAKLDIEFLLDEHANNIKMEKSYIELMKDVRKMKRALA